MKYTLFGFGQAESVSLGLDLVDLALLRHILDFWPAMEKVLHDGHEYGWVSAQHVSDELPIIGAKPQAVRRRLKALCDMGLIDGHTPKPRKGENRKAYYRPLPALAALQRNGAPKHQATTKPAPAREPTKKAANKGRKGYGEYGHCMLTEKEFETLKVEFPTDWQAWIRRVDEYCESTGKGYKNGLATTRSWARRDAERDGSKAAQKPESPTDPLFAEAKAYWQNVMKHRMLDAEHIAALRANEEFMAGLDPRDVEYLGELEAKAQGRLL